MTNDLETTETISNKLDYKILLILGVGHRVKRELRILHTTFGRFGLFHLPTEQLIFRIDMLLQHYHTSTTLSNKLDASLDTFNYNWALPTIHLLCPLRSGDI